ncbi:MAG: hypothetical protein ACKOD5_08635, partial [Chthoniobacterales bacterium]
RGQLQKLGAAMSLSVLLQQPPAVLTEVLREAGHEVGREPWREFVNLMITRLPIAEGAAAG